MSSMKIPGAIPVQQMPTVDQFDQKLRQAAEAYEKQFLGKLSDWKNIEDLIPLDFKNSKSKSRTGNAGILSASLELVKEGNITLKQNNLFDDIFIKEK